MYAKTAGKFNYWHYLIPTPSSILEIGNKDDKGIIIEGITSGGSLTSFGMTDYILGNRGRSGDSPWFRKSHTPANRRFFPLTLISCHSER